MSTGIQKNMFLHGKARPALNADSFIAIYEPIFLDKAEYSTSQIPVVLHGLLRG
jgi:hypothetical protein